MRGNVAFVLQCNAPETALLSDPEGRLNLGSSGLSFRFRTINRSGFSKARRTVEKIHPMLGLYERESVFSSVQTPRSPVRVEKFPRREHAEIIDSLAQ